MGAFLSHSCEEGQVINGEQTQARHWKSNPLWVW
jgi:hypothetical protein